MSGEIFAHKYDATDVRYCIVHNLLVVVAVVAIAVATGSGWAALGLAFFMVPSKQPVSHPSSENP